MMRSEAKCSAVSPGEKERKRFAVQTGDKLVSFMSAVIFFLVYIYCFIW